MKGIIFNLVEESVVAEHGEETWDQLLDAAGVDGAYTALGNYPDAELVRLVEVGSTALDVTPADLTRRLGVAALLGLSERYPQFFEGHTETASFLLTLNEVIHTEVRKLHSDATPPTFTFDRDGEDLVMGYYSIRRLCHLAEGMIAGAATHFGERASVSQSSCVLEGAEHCIIRARFTPAVSPPAAAP